MHNNKYITHLVRMHQLVYLALIHLCAVLLLLFFLNARDCLLGDETSVP